MSIPYEIVVKYFKAVESERQAWIKGKKINTSNYQTILKRFADNYWQMSISDQERFDFIFRGIVCGERIQEEDDNEKNIDEETTYIKNYLKENNFIESI